MFTPNKDGSKTQSVYSFPVKLDEQVSLLCFLMETWAKHFLNILVSRMKNSAQLRRHQLLINFLPHIYSCIVEKASKIMPGEIMLGYNDECNI